MNAMNTYYKQNVIIFDIGRGAFPMNYKLNNNHNNDRSNYGPY